MKLVPVFTQDELGEATCYCDDPECANDVLFFHAQCHIESGLEASYDKGSGWLTLTCAECHQQVCQLLLGKSADLPWNKGAK